MELSWAAVVIIHVVVVREARAVAARGPHAGVALLVRRGGLLGAVPCWRTLVSMLRISFSSSCCWVCHCCCCLDCCCTCGHAAAAPAAAASPPLRW